MRQHWRQGRLPAGARPEQTSTRLDESGRTLNPNPALSRNLDPNPSLLAAGFPPARARSLDDDDVVLVAPFDEELDDAEEEDNPASALDPIANPAEQPSTSQANHVSEHQVPVGPLLSPTQHRPDAVGLVSQSICFVWFGAGCLTLG